VLTGFEFEGLFERIADGIAAGEDHTVQGAAEGDANGAPCACAREEGSVMKDDE